MWLTSRCDTLAFLPVEIMFECCNAKQHALYWDDRAQQLHEVRHHLLWSSKEKERIDRRKGVHKYPRAAAKIIRC